MLTSNLRSCKIPNQPFPPLYKSTTIINIQFLFEIQADEYKKLKLFLKSITIF